MLIFDFTAKAAMEQVKARRPGAKFEATRADSRLGYNSLTEILTAVRSSNTLASLSALNMLSRGLSFKCRRALATVILL